MQPRVPLRSRAGAALFSLPDLAEEGAGEAEGEEGGASGNGNQAGLLQADLRARLLQAAMERPGDE